MTRWFHRQHQPRRKRTDMGYGGYSTEDHAKITQVRSTMRAEEVFTTRKLHPLMDPKGVNIREARDSAEHPNTIPIAFILDETGSMDHIPKALAKDELPTFMETLLNAGVQDPQVMFMAVGDAKCNEQAPIQVGQFESTAQGMDQWLTWTFLEEGGGGNGGESYDLAAYFLARHTETDALKLRGKKGYAFFTGDDNPFPVVSAREVGTHFGDKLTSDIPISQMFEELDRSYNTFFVIPHGHDRGGVSNRWRALLGDRVISLAAEGITSYVAAGAVVLTEGLVSDLVTYAETLKNDGVAGDVVGAVVRSLTPYANSLGRAGVPGPKAETVSLPRR